MKTVLRIYCPGVWALLSLFDSEIQSILKFYSTYIYTYNKGTINSLIQELKSYSIAQADHVLNNNAT